MVADEVCTHERIEKELVPPKPVMASAFIPVLKCPVVVVIAPAPPGAMAVLPTAASPVRVPPVAETLSLSVSRSQCAIRLA